MKANEQETMKENRGGVGVCSEHTHKMLPESSGPVQREGPACAKTGKQETGW